MSSPGDFNSQLADLATKLAGMVAERLAWASRDSDPSDRRRILEMIENNLPNIIANSIAKAPSLHSASGVAYFEENLESFAETYTKKFAGQL